VSIAVSPPYAFTKDWYVQLFHFLSSGRNSIRVSDTRPEVSRTHPDGSRAHPEVLRTLHQSCLPPESYGLRQDLIGLYPKLRAPYSGEGHSVRAEAKALLSQSHSPLREIVCTRRATVFNSIFELTPHWVLNLINLILVLWNIVFSSDTSAFFSSAWFPGTLSFPDVIFHSGWFSDLRCFSDFTSTPGFHNPTLECSISTLLIKSITSDNLYNSPHLWYLIFRSTMAFWFCLCVPPDWLCHLWNVSTFNSFGFSSYHLWITLHIRYDPLINRIMHNPFPICYYRKCLRPPTSFSAFPQTPIFGLATSFPSGSFPVRYPISISPCIGFHYPPCRRTLSFMIVFCRVFGFGFPLTMARLGSCLHSGWHLFLGFTPDLPSIPFPTHPCLLQYPHFCIFSDPYLSDPISAFLHIFGSVPIGSIIRVFCNIHVSAYFRIRTYWIHHPCFLQCPRFA